MHQLLLVMFLWGSTIILNINIANLIPDYYDMVLFLVLTAVTFPLIWVGLLVPLYMVAEFKAPSWFDYLYSVYMASSSLFCIYKLTILTTTDDIQRMVIFFMLISFLIYSIIRVYSNPREIK